jgi:hypothetical protein
VKESSIPRILVAFEQGCLRTQRGHEKISRATFCVMREDRKRASI